MNILRMFSNVDMGTDNYNNNNNSNSIDLAEIQIQRGVEQWRTVQSTENYPEVIYHNMVEIAEMYPSFRVRAVDSSGRVLDIL